VLQLELERVDLEAKLKWEIFEWENFCGFAALLWLLQGPAEQSQQGHQNNPTMRLAGVVKSVNSTIGIWTAVGVIVAACQDLLNGRRKVEELRIFILDQDKISWQSSMRFTKVW